MGITGLIPFLSEASSKINISELRGSTVAIDTYCWLHKGAFACADKLARGEETTTHIQYCLKYVNMLLSHNIKPILVFDGQHLPAKADTELKRRESKKEAREKALEFLRKGRGDKAFSYFRRCVDITHEMALQLIKECRSINVDCIVAPYEADAQLAYLNKINIAEYVITEDSDLVLFGCKKILFKLDLTGSCLLVDSSKIHLAMGCNEQKYSFEKFRYMCILSGCDYLKSLPGVGLVKACKFVLLTEETDIYKALLKIPSYLNLKQVTVTDEYREEFMKAVSTFRHMLVYDPIQRKVLPLNELKDFDTEEKYCSNAGQFMNDSDKEYQLALGNLNPFSLKKLDDWNPDKRASSKQIKKQKSLNGWTDNSISMKHPSIWKSTSLHTFMRTVPKIEKQTKITRRMIKIKKIDISDDDTTSCSGPLSETDLFLQYSTPSPTTRSNTLDSTKRKASDIQSSPSPKKHCISSFLRSNYSVKTEPQKLLLSQTSPVKHISGFTKSTPVLEKNKDKPILSKFFNVAKTENSINVKTESMQMEIKDNGIINYYEIGEDSNLDQNSRDSELPNSQSSNIENICSSFSYNQQKIGLKITSENKTKNSPEKLHSISSTNSPKKSPIKLSKISPIKSNSKIRLGLSKKNAISTTSVQSKLSQFGFQKKNILK